MSKYQYYSNEQITNLGPNEVFVFGSNLAGIHGAGAAKQALKFGAKIGVGYGKYGNTWAIPTKDGNIKTLPLSDIQMRVWGFLDWAETLYKDGEPDTFVVTKIGCGLAGYKDWQIAPMFNGAPSNCKFHIDWKPYLEENWE
jgi:hypothetical protein